MRSVRFVVVVVGAMLALTLAGASASAATPKNFHLDKTCGPDATEPLGYVCTVQHSDFKWIPPGTKIHYLSQNAARDVVQAYIAIKNGSTKGECVWSVPDFLTAVCTFGPGAGRLTHFHLVVKVGTNAGQSIWYWDGTYWFGGRH